MSAVSRTNATAGPLISGRPGTPNLPLELIVNQTDRWARYAAAMDAVTGGTAPAKLVDAVVAVADAELMQAQAEAHQYRTALQGAARRAAVVAPPTDRADLREGIAAAIHADLTSTAYRRDGGLLGVVPRLADAVLAVLPEQTDRAAVLLEAADRLIALRDSLITGPEFTGRFLAGLERGASELRRLAAEAQQQPETEAPWASDGARIGRTLIWSCADIGKDEFGRGYRAAQEEARAILTRPLMPAPVAQQPAAEDVCRPVEVDGETIRVHGASEMTEQDREFFGEIVRAAKRKYAAEHGDEQQAAAADDERA